MADLNAPQPPPAPNSGRPIWELVIEDMRARDHFGRAKYGTPLQLGNGRDHLVDAYQELLDQAVYLRQEIEHRRDVERLAIERCAKAADEHAQAAFGVERYEAGRLIAAQIRGLLKVGPQPAGPAVERSSLAVEERLLEAAASVASAAHLQAVAARALAACRARGWSVDWSRRGAYLFLECAELVESLRGKGTSSPAEESADVLTVLLSIFGAFKIDVAEVFRLMDVKLEKIERGTIGAEPGQEKP